MPRRCSCTGTRWLVEVLCRWTATIASFAQGRLSRRFTDPQAFVVLRNQLLVTLRWRAAEVHGPEREFYLRLEELISPWVSTCSLAREDREILRDVLARCQQVGRILEGRSEGDAAGGRLAGGWLAVVSAVLAVASVLPFWGLVIQ